MEYVFSRWWETKEQLEKWQDEEWSKGNRVKASVILRVLERMERRWCVYSKKVYSERV